MIPGLFLNIKMLLEMKHGVTLLPAEAIQRDAQSEFVWVIQPHFTGVKGLRSPKGPASEAIQQGPSFLWEVQQSDNTVTRRRVRTGVEDGKWVEIQSGLSPGEIVATSRFNELREGQRVRYELAPKGE
jgi:multidrug efflux system membrane fusion protein